MYKCQKQVMDTSSSNDSLSTDDEKPFVDSSFLLIDAPTSAFSNDTKDSASIEETRISFQWSDCDDTGASPCKGLKDMPLPSTIVNQTQRLDLNEEVEDLTIIKFD